MTLDEWAKVKKEIQKEVGTGAYKNWIAPLEFLSIKEAIN